MSSPVMVQGLTDWILHNTALLNSAIRALNMASPPDGPEAPLTLSAATTLAAGIVLIAILYHITLGQRYKGKRLPPGPLFTLPLLGEGVELGLNVEHPVAFFYKRCVLPHATAVAAASF